MSKALKAGKKPLYNLPFPRESADIVEQDNDVEQESDEDVLEEVDNFSNEDEDIETEE